MSSVRLKWIVAGAAALLPLAFAAFTQHAWEDYFITLRSSRNLVDGHGLVFNPGERVHTFTSPLGVLLPALCTALSGPGREELALWIFRCINAALLGASAALLWQRVTALGVGAVGRVVLFGLIFADAKLVDFSINGMETAILAFFLLVLWCELESPEPPRVAVLALAIAGLMWTRPDAFILGAAILLPRVLIRGRAGATPRIPIPWTTLLRGGLLGGALYVPWFAWAWWYYGTPVPHTVIAKSAYTAPVQWTNLVLLPWQTLTGKSALVDLFLPTYWTFGGWPAFLPRVAHALAGIAAFAWLVPGFPVAARRASLAVFIGMFYLESIILFPWYVPPWTVLAAIALALSIDALHAHCRERKNNTLALALRVTAVAVVAIQAAMLAASAWQMRVEQRLVETGVRRNLGEWLRAHAAAGDTVFLEPLGYIGYFSQLKTYDFPGLSSPEVVSAVRGGARRYADVIARLRPTWVVLRPHEAARPEFPATRVLEHYDLVKSWSALPALDDVAFLPGRVWVEGEAQFLLFRRKAAASRP
jgi:hypothetical protein